MKSFLLTVMFLGLVAVLRAQEDPLEDSEEFSGIWYTKAMVCDKNHTKGKTPKKVYPVEVTALEDGDWEVKLTFWKKGQCHKKKIVMKRTDQPGKYVALNDKDKKVFYLQELSDKKHFIFYCEGQHNGKSYRLGNLLGRDSEESPEAIEEFKKFVQSKKLLQENIFIPEQGDQCTPEND